MTAWGVLEDLLEAIEVARPTTALGVLEILGRRETETGIAAAFYLGVDLDEPLLDALQAADWVVEWQGSDEFYVVRHPETGETLTYDEGDVLEGDHRPLCEVQA